MTGIAVITWEQFQRDWPLRWEALLQGRPEGENPFLSPPWLQAWWANFGKDQRSEILLDPDRQAALFTRHLRESYHGAPLRMVRAWVNSHCTRAGVVPGTSPEQFAKNLARHWQQTRKDWDVLRLQGLPAEFAALLTPSLAAQSFKVICERQWTHYWLPIDQPWPAYFAALSSETRRVQGRHGRRLARLGHCEWQHAEGQAVAQALEQYFEIEAHSWKVQSGEVIREHPHLLAFYRQMMRDFAAVQQAKVDLLLLDGLPICGTLSLMRQNRQLTLKTSYRQEFAKYSPGWHLFKAMLEGVFAGGAVDTVDFYSDSAFSGGWARQKTAFCDLLVFGTSLRGRLAGFAKGIQGRFRR